MSIRRVMIVLLCEDTQHEIFVRRFLKGLGWNTRDIRVNKSPSAGGSAEQWVRMQFPAELMHYRQRKNKAASALIVMIDADNKKSQERILEFKDECKAKNIHFRADDEAVAIAVPKRNIETWIHFLMGEAVDEENAFSRLERERGCKPAVDVLVGRCRSTGLPRDAPRSLTAACDEYNSRIKEMSWR
ncbi:MAG: hypothetical protein V1816_04865 [Pseudomonadota bacterium]